MPLLMLAVPFHALCLLLVRPRRTESTTTNPTHSQNLPTILHSSPLQILASPFYTNSNSELLWKCTYARARKRTSRTSNYNDADQRKRKSRTYKIQTRWTRDKQRKSKQRKNPMTTTRIQWHKSNNSNTHNVPRSVRKPNTPTTNERALKCECINFNSGMSN